MKTRTKAWLIIASFFIVLGTAMFVGVMSRYDWDFTKLSTVKYEQSIYELNGDFKNISINTNVADIVFEVSENEECSVSCYEAKNLNHAVSIIDGTLKIEVVDMREWYDHIGINFTSPKITVYLPKIEYEALKIDESTGNIEIPKDITFKNIDISTSTGNVRNYASALDDIKIKTDTGNICIEDIYAEKLDLSASTGEIMLSNINCEGDIKISVSTGKTNITNVNCRNIISKGSTGDIMFKSLKAADKISVERSTGDVRIDNCDAGEIFIKTDTGDVTATVRSEKIFVTETDTGKVEVPKTTQGGKCEIITSTGDIKVGIVD